MVKMKTVCFNLVDEPWLPVTLADGFPGGGNRGALPRVSLRETFEHGDKIVDLRCYAHERIGLMRLLICIAQRALNGPRDEEEWKRCSAQMAEKVVRYLDNKKDCFNLFGDKPRFLQAHGGGEPGQMPVFRLTLVDKDGTTLFDAHVRPGGRMDADSLAVALVTYQCFAAPGMTGGNEPSRAARKTKGGKLKMERQFGETTLCREGGALHSFILGANLAETIHWNLLCKSQITAPMTWQASAKPIWEYREMEAAKLPESQIKTDYLGRLAPLARAVWLGRDGEQAEIANGLRYGVFADTKDQKTKRIKPGTGIREPTASVASEQGTEGKDRLVSAKAGGDLPKAAWRELHSIAVLRRAGKRGGPTALEHLRTRSVQAAQLWCGALVGPQAKVGDIVESVFRLPVHFLEDADATSVDDPRECPGANKTYRKGVALADAWVGRLHGAVFAYHLRLADDLSKKQNSKRRGKIMNQAATRFWTALEQLAESLLLNDLAVHSDRYWSNDVNWMAKSPWGREVWKAAHDAYEFACPHATPRQLRAYAAGLARLRGEGRPKSKSPDKTDDDDSNEGGEE